MTQRLTISKSEEEFAKCAADVWYFATRYCTILTRDQGPIRFQPWEHIRVVLDLSRKHPRLIILKARQNGVSWGFIIDALHTALFTEGGSAVFFSRRGEDAVEMKNKARFVWKNLPPFLQQPLGKDNDEVMTIPGMNSQLQSYPAVEGSGRSGSATLLVLDEWAHIPDAERLYVGILPMVEKGRLVGISTANGLGGIFSDTYWAAKRGENSFHPHFIPWNVLVTRSRGWWEQQKKDMPLYFALQEYPEFDTDAFMVSGTCMFVSENLKAMPASPRLNQVVYESGVSLDIWAEYNPDHKYSAGCDTAIGITKGDYSCLQIVDDFTGEQAARIRTNLPLEKFGDALVASLPMYGNPFIVIEEQTQGRYIAQRLKEAKYPIGKVYHARPDFPCWRSTEVTRNQLLQQLEQAVRLQTIVMYSLETIQECLQFGYKQHKTPSGEIKGRFEALSGHDDQVLALALAWLGKTGMPKYVDKPPVSYLGAVTSQIIQVDDINWNLADPLKGLRPATCPACEGVLSRQYSCGKCNQTGVVLFYVK